MPNHSPDFYAIAEQLAPPQFVWLVVDGLRQVWNARGAADVATIEAELASRTGTGPTRPPRMQDLKRALGSLDR